MTSLNSKLQLALLNRKKGRNLLEKGFTLVELMIVIVIVGVLSSVALPNLWMHKPSDRKNQDVTSARSPWHSLYFRLQRINNNSNWLNLNAIKATTIP